MQREFGLNSIDTYSLGIAKVLGDTYGPPRRRYITVGTTTRLFLGIAAAAVVRDKRLVQHARLQRQGNQRNVGISVT